MLLRWWRFVDEIAVSVEFTVGQEVVEKRRWKEHEHFFRMVLELGRRHKVLNPDRMRKFFVLLLFFHRLSRHQARNMAA